MCAIFGKNVIVYLFVAVTCDTQGSQVSRAFLFLFTNRNSISNIHQFQLQDLRLEDCVYMKQKL